MFFAIVPIINKAFKLFKLVLVVYCDSCCHWWYPGNSRKPKTVYNVLKPLEQLSLYLHLDLVFHGDTIFQPILIPNVSSKEVFLWETVTDMKRWTLWGRPKQCLPQACLKFCTLCANIWSVFMWVEHIWRTNNHEVRSNLKGHIIPMGHVSWIF